MMTCIIASIIAMSVPGNGWMNRSPRSTSIASAVSVRIGSITTMRAPLARAFSIVGHRCRLVSLVFVPHSRISLECSSSSGVHRPTAAVGHPEPGTDGRPADVAVDPRRTHAPEEPAAQPHHRQQALVAGIGERQDGFGAVRVDHVVETGGDLGRALRPT